MKLQNRYSKVFLLVAIPAFLLISVIYYFMTLQVITNKAEESLLEDKDYIISQIEESDKLLDLFLNLSDDYHLRSIEESAPVKDQFSTVMIYDHKEQDEEPYRQLFTIIKHHDRYFELTIRKSLVEYNSLVYTIILIGIIFLAMLTIGFIFINQVLTKSIWSPFFRTIKMLERYDPESKQSLILENSTTDEFQLLNTAVYEMTTKIRENFSRQKQFIDHIAHETQTPLAIINANIDLLIQNENFSKGDYKSMQNIVETSSRLSKVIKSLLMLSRVQNSQFKEIRRVNLTELITKYFKVNDEQLKDKKITLEQKIELDFLADMDPILAEILISNICQNAIRHNVMGGSIVVKSSHDVIEKGQLLEVTNTGQHPSLAPKELLKRFIKSSKDPNSTGLGLPLIAEISNLNNLKLDYRIKDNWHLLSLRHAT